MSDGDGEWIWLDSITLSCWVLLTTLLDIDLTLPTCFFFVITLEDPPWVPLTLVSSEFIREIDPEVVYDFGGSSWVICCNATSVSAIFHSAFEGWPISPITWEGTWLVDHEVRLTVGLTELDKRGTVFKAKLSFWLALDFNLFPYQLACLGYSLLMPIK